MIIGIGIDIIEISRIEKAASKEEFVNKVFTQDEIKYFDSRNRRPEVIAGNFASKEAVVKAMSVGFRNFEWKDIEVLRDSLGKPYVILHNNARNMLGNNCIIHVTISHCQNYAVANAIIEDWDSMSTYSKNYAFAEEK